ncbi:MAG: ATP-dependent DNA helicase [Candidatus Gastranaerophilales bacterium]|nr:ATP-dependent DNA helicase [Candidatus Gastranaerophilales bacterium]
MINAQIQPSKITPNEKQSECIRTLEGPVMVLAGPGTGKTFSIIHRLAYMLEEGITPESILCLTFSETAAAEMKSRLVQQTGTIASGVAIHTYHAFCNEIIRQYPSHFDLLEGVSLIDDVTKFDLMKKVVDEFNPKFHLTKWGEADFYIKELISAVAEIKKNRMEKTAYFDNLKTHPDWMPKFMQMQEEYKEREEKGKLVKTFLSNFERQQKKIGKAREAWEIYECYDLLLKKNNFIDFDDMINLVLEVFDENTEFLSLVAKKFKYFLVDEYQDTNVSQNQIVFKLAQGAKSENIFVVGDDDQIIFGFQGAQTDNLENFLEKYPRTKVICLNENNRSSQTILDLSYEVISQDGSRLEINPKFQSYNISKRLTAKNQTICAKDQKVKIHGFEDLKQENNFIAEDIENLINSGTLPANDNGEADLSQIAILSRRNDELMEFAELLKAKNIPFQIKSTKSIFQINASLLIYFYLKVLDNNAYYTDKLFGLLLSQPFEFETEDYLFLMEQNKLNHRDFIFNISENLDKNWVNKEKVVGFMEAFNSLKELKSHTHPKNLIIELINKTGILAYYLNSEINRTENILAVKKITDEAAAFLNLKSYCTLGEFLEHLDTAYKEDIDISTDKDDFTRNAVQLVTLHGAKGREFAHVYIPNLVAARWEKNPSRQGASLPIEKTSSVPEEEAKNAELLKLLFVGITRAKYALNLSYSNMINNKPQELTSYLTNITNNDNLFEKYNHTLSGENYLFEIAKSFSIKDFDYKKEFKEELKAMLKNFVLSPSALNSYLNCPRNFLYSYVLKIPILDKEWEMANYGNSIHKTLEYSVSIAKEKGEYPDKIGVLEVFKKKIGEQKFEDEKQRNIYQKRGISSLEKFYPKMLETPPKNIFATEFAFDFVPVENGFVKGFIDRIEQNSDGTFSLFDYKTGSAKSKAQIADGKDYESYLNQLRFYKFAFETLYEGSKVSQTGLIFVEEFDKNFYTALTDEDNKKIKEKITATYENINALNFSPIEQNDKNCCFCEYRQLCNLNIL